MADTKQSKSRALASNVIYAAFTIGGFTSDAKIAARDSHIHVELIDLTRFIELWQDFYGKLDDEDKALLPLRPVYFLAPGE